MKASKNRINRIIGLEMHPDVFAAAALENKDAGSAKVVWVQDRQATAHLEKWVSKHLQTGDILVLEASGNSCQMASRLHALGCLAIVLESAQAAKVRENFCSDDRHSAIKPARVYLSGLAKIVWQPDETTRQLREVFFLHQSMVRDCTRQRGRSRSQTCYWNLAPI